MEVYSDERWVDKFVDDLYTLARETGREFGDVVRANGRLLAINLAIQTQPWDGKEGNFAQLKSGAMKYSGITDRQHGEGAVRRDVGKVYSTIQEVYEIIQRKSPNDGAAKRFYAAAMNGNLDLAKKILRSFHIFLATPIGQFDGGTAHKGRRNQRGRVSGKQTSLIVINPKAVGAYAKLIAKKVGTGKGGWAACAGQLGSMRGLPQWVTRNAAHGHVSDHTRDLNDPHVVLTNSVAYVDQIINGNGVADAARITSEKMEKQIEHVVAANARKRGWIATAPAGQAAVPFS